MPCRFSENFYSKKVNLCILGKSVEKLTLKVLLKNQSFLFNLGKDATKYRMPELLR